MAVDVVSDVVGDALGAPLSEVALAELEGALQDCQAYDRQRGARGNAERIDVGRARRPDSFFLPADTNAAVDDVLNQVRRDQVDAGRQEEGHVSDSRRLPVLPEVAEQADDDRRLHQIPTCAAVAGCSGSGSTALPLL